MKDRSEHEAEKRNGNSFSLGLTDISGRGRFYSIILTIPSKFEGGYRRGYS